MKCQWNNFHILKKLIALLQLFIVFQYEFVVVGPGKSLYCVVNVISWNPRCIVPAIFPTGCTTGKHILTHITYLLTVIDISINNTYEHILSASLYAFPLTYICMYVCRQSTNNFIILRINTKCLHISPTVLRTSRAVNENMLKSYLQLVF